ncbi:MAG: PilW family protein [Cellvibrionaceae bacterium]
MKLVDSSMRQHQLGLGLIELMISMLIGLFIMAGVVQMFSTTTQNAVANTGLSRIQENSRYVYARITEDIAQTGNLGCVSTTVSRDTGDGPENFFANNNLLGLASAAGEPFDFSSIVNGDQAANAATNPAGLVAAGTDTFRVRYVNHRFRIPLAVSYFPNPNSVATNFVIIDQADNNYPRLSQYQVVALTNCEIGAVFMISNDPSVSAGRIEFDTGIVAPNNGINGGQFNVRNTLEVGLNSFVPVEIDTNRETDKIGLTPTYLYGGTTGSSLYFIGTAASAGAGEVCVPGTTPQYCALFRRFEGINEELVEGVSNMEVFYGWTDAAGLLFFSRANGVTDWSRVDRLRVVMEFNSIEGVSSQGNTVDTSENGLIVRQVERTFNLSNQL